MELLKPSAVSSFDSCLTFAWPCISAGLGCVGILLAATARPLERWASCFQAVAEERLLGLEVAACFTFSNTLHLLNTKY